MKKIVEAKLQESSEQLAIWRQKFAEAQEQCIRWDSAAQVLRELLAEDAPPVLAEET